MKGTVFWITGLSGSGKTTIGRTLCDRLNLQGRTAVFLDGDILREIFGNDLGYSLEDRRISAGRNSRICKALSDQGVDVVCATVSLFHAVHEWNRKNISNYREIFLDVSSEVLRSRDQKGLYSGSEKGQVKDVVGLDLSVEKPLAPDMVFNNDGTSTPAELCALILGKLNSKQTNHMEQQT